MYKSNFFDVISVDIKKHPLFNKELRLYLIYKRVLKLRAKRKPNYKWFIKYYLYSCNNIIDVLLLPVSLYKYHKSFKSG